jgi:prolipoprotein diacylglyceryl transferase
MIHLLSSIPSPPSQQLELGPLNFRFYGLMIALGVLAAVAIARRRWSALGGDPEDITTIALVAVPAGLIGARLYHVITDWSRLYSGGRWWPDAFAIWNGGLGIPGGVLVGVAAGVVVCRRIQVDWRHVADAAAPAIPVAQAIGRLGNWFNQELYGRPTDLPWALRIDDPEGYPPGTTFHPTFLYEGLWNLALAGLIVLGGRRLVLKPGRWMAVYVAGYGLGRLWVESLRVDVATEFGGLRVNTWISLVAIAGGLLWLFWGGNPVAKEETAELRAGGDPRAHVGVRGGALVDSGEVTDDEVHRAAREIEPDEVQPRRSGEHDTAAAADVAANDGDAAADGGAEDDDGVAAGPGPDGAGDGPAQA